MADQPSLRISTRKEPKQARSASLVADILEAAAQVLAEVGAQRFTTARVAEKAGVSVGSLYQYFPNKAAILFRLQTDEWKQTGDMLLAILSQTDKPPSTRLRNVVLAFIQSECEEAEMRIALHDAVPLYRNAPETKKARTSEGDILQSLLQEALPGAPVSTRTLVSDLILATMSAVGKKFSEAPRTSAEIKTYANALADMFCAYLETLKTR